MSTSTEEVPKKRMKKAFPEWMTKDVQRARNKKLKYWKKFKNSKSEEDLEKYKKVRNQTIQLYRQSKKNLVENVGSEAQSTSKANDKLAPLKDNHGTTEVDKEHNLDAAMSQSTPDADSVKLFIGQIPRELSEEEIRSMFEMFGPVYSIIMLKDHKTQENKGCCFLQFYKRQAALDAQNQWHGKKIMPGLKHPMQVKPANSELKSEEERRLFVGMISRSMTQDELMTMFTPFGALDDCVILVDSDGNSKGCAFVTFTTQLSAMNAVKALHQSRTFEGCKSPMVVKFADTQQQKELKRHVSQPPVPPNLSGYSSVMHAGHRPPMNVVQPSDAWLDEESLSLKKELRQSQRDYKKASDEDKVALGEIVKDKRREYLALRRLRECESGAGPSQQVKKKKLESAAGSAPPPFPGFGAPPANPFAPGGHGGPIPGGPFSSPPPTASPMMDPAQCMQGFQALAQLASNPVLSTLLNPAVVQQFAAAAAVMSGTSQPSTSNKPPGSFPFPGSSMPPMNFGGPAAGPPHNTSKFGKDREGPEGCNLFIYNVPPTYTDAELYNMFSPFGNIVSATIFIDKITKTSKGYGFVSYDNKLSANNAIKSMNGFRIGNGRLKVQLKTPKGSRPY